MSKLLQILRLLLVAITITSGTVKILGIRMDFMRITHVEFQDWQITLFGLTQIVVGLLIAYPKSQIIGLFAYSSIYLFASYFYFAHNLSPKLVPIVLSVLPITLLIERTLNKSE